MVRGISQGLGSAWPEVADQKVSSPKRWMDGYLAAFAIAEKLRLVTFDRGFRSFESKGLDLMVLS